MNYQSVESESGGQLDVVEITLGLLSQVHCAYGAASEILLEDE